MKRRMLIFFVAIIVGMLVLVIRAYDLQIVRGAEYRIQVQNMFKKLVSIPAPRGEIYDRNGKKLAWNVRKLRLSASPGFNWKRLEDFLKRCPGIDAENITKQLRNGGSVELSLPPSVETRLWSIRGLRVEVTFRRFYRGEAFGHLVGYVNREGKGIAGVEKYYDDLLAGFDGLLMIRAHDGQLIDSIPPIPGEPLRLTIDADLQEYVYNLMKEERKPGAAIVMNPKTGEVYALVSYPGYDSNALSMGVDEAKWRLMSADPRGRFINRAISAAYPPGSAIKPLVLLAALYYNEKETRELVINCKGRYDLKDEEGNLLYSFSDWYPLGHGETDYIKAMAVSCNVFFYKLGMEIGINAIREMASFVKLDGLTGIDLPGEKEGVIPDPYWKRVHVGEPWYIGDTLLTAIGQGYARLTPLELICFYNLIATHGEFYEPHVAIRENVKPKFVLEFGPVYDDIVRSLVQVTTREGKTPKEHGTAYEIFKDFPLTVAGKTGTAEVWGGRAPHSWFVGFAPAEDPQVSVLVFVENGGYGSQTAAPIARKILARFFKIPETEDEE